VFVYAVLLFPVRGRVILVGSSERVKERDRIYS
jgi:hypothetical protein